MATNEVDQGSATAIRTVKKSAALAQAAGSRQLGSALWAVWSNTPVVISYPTLAVHGMSKLSNGLRSRIKSRLKSDAARNAAVTVLSLRRRLLLHVLPVFQMVSMSKPGKIVIVSQHGLPYLPLMVMDTLKLVEKHAVKAGIFSLKPEYKTLGGTQSLIDALLSGQMHFGVTGVPGLATLWDKTAGTANEVRALSAVQSMPFMLVTNRESIKTIKDFTDKDKIAVPAIKVSNQAICLQMAAAKEWGQDQYARLDPFTINRAHPDAAASVISKATEVNSHYSVAPYYYYELAAPGVHNVLKSYDTLGGPTTNGVMLMTKKFRDANPEGDGRGFRRAQRGGGVHQ